MLAVTWDAVVAPQGLKACTAEAALKLKAEVQEPSRAHLSSSTDDVIIESIFLTVLQKHLLTFKDSINIFHVYSVLQVTHAIMYKDFAHTD